MNGPAWRPRQRPSSRNVHADARTPPCRTETPRRRRRRRDDCGTAQHLSRLELARDGQLPEGLVHKSKMSCIRSRITGRGRPRSVRTCPNGGAAERLGSKEMTTATTSGAPSLVLDSDELCPRLRADQRHPPVRVRQAPGLRSRHRPRRARARRRLRHRPAGLPYRRAGRPRGPGAGYRSAAAAHRPRPAARATTSPSRSATPTTSAACRTGASTWSC